jgi:hypothetical protein
MTQHLLTTAEQHVLTVEQKIEKLDPDGTLRHLATADIKKLDVDGQMRLLYCIAKDSPTSVDDFGGDQNAMMTDFVLSVIEGAMLCGVQEEKATSVVQKSRPLFLAGVRRLRDTLKKNGLKEMNSHFGSMVLGFGMLGPTIEDQKEKAARTNKVRFETIRELCEAGHSDQKIAMILNSRGIRNLRGNDYTKDAIKRYRRAHQLKKRGDI